MLLVAAVFAAKSAAAQAPKPRSRATEEPPPTAEEPPPTAPGEARGSDASEDDADAQLWIPRALFAVPRLAFDVATMPLVGVAAVEDEYQVVDHAEDLFFNDARTFGVFPTAFVETGLTPNVGLRVVHRDLLGEGERMRLRAGYGGVQRQVYEGRLRVAPSGSHTALGFAVGYRRENRDRFYGIGNADERAAVPTTPRLDPFDPIGAAGATYRSTESWMRAAASARIAPTIALSISQTWRRRALDGSTDEEDDVALVELYDTSELAGFDDDRLDLILEVELDVDTRVSRRHDMPSDQPASGWHVTGAAARQTGPHLRGSDFSRLRLDVNRYVDLYRGNRILRLRLRGIWVVGDIRRISFPDLATLGGGEHLRGYRRDRFRDRISTLGSAEYRYPVGEGLSGYLFSDVGRVFHDFGELAPANLRVGFGGGIRLYSTGNTLLRVQLASSIDGGLWFRLEVNPDDDA